jgi:hypothetical protein
MYHPPEDVHHGAGVDKKGPITFRLKLPEALVAGTSTIKVTMSGNLSAAAATEMRCVFKEVSTGK